MSANQQALLMASGNAVVVEEACEADPYYSCGPTNDPYWANVVLMLHFDGANGATTFTDSSSYARAMTAFGNAQLSTTSPQFGTAAALFDGTGDYVSTPTAAELNLGSGDFTIEFWIKANNFTSNPYVLSGRLGTQVWYLNFAVSTGYVIWGNGGTINSTQQITSSLPATGSWVHFAIVRSGTELTAFVGGIRALTVTNAIDFTGSANGLSVGADYNGTNCLDGRIDDLRITKGVARYTGNFNIPTAAFPDALETVWDPADPRTVLSLHADDVTVEDSSCYQPKTVTLAGTLGNIAIVTDLAYKFGGKSFFVPNSGSASTAGVVISDHQDLGFGTGDFTIEMWAYHSSNDYAGTLFYYTEGGAFSFVVAATTGLVTINYYTSGGAQSIATGVIFPLTTWQHVVVQRRGTNFEFYLDGVLGNTTAITGGASSTVNSAGDFYLGRTNASSALSWNGYIDEARITKGVARYTAAFDPATMPNCDSVVPGSVTAVDGSSHLTGASVAVSQQTIRDQNGAVALSGVRATAIAGSLFADSVTQNKTVALTGRSVTVSRGILANAAYPDLSSSSIGTITVIAPGAGGLTVFFDFDGTYRITDTNGIVWKNASWIDTDQAAYEIPAIASQYRIVSVAIAAGPAWAYTYPATPVFLASSFTLQIYNFTQTFIYFDFQVTIAPTETNPRYGENYYSGTHRVQTFIRTE